MGRAARWRTGALPLGAATVLQIGCAGGDGGETVTLMTVPAGISSPGPRARAPGSA